MAEPIHLADVLQPLELVKALLALLCVILFLYYRKSYEEAKRHLPVHFFYAKWRTARHAFILGLASLCFAAGFTLELLGAGIGLSQGMAAVLASLFEAGGLFFVLYMFFTLAIEDVPHFQHISESARKPHRHAEIPVPLPPKSEKARIAGRGKKMKRRR
jgi:hypothetical protein